MLSPSWLRFLERRSQNPRKNHLFLLSRSARYVLVTHRFRCPCNTLLDLIIPSPFQQVTDKPEDLLQLRARMTAPRFAMFGQSSLFIFVEGIILCEVSTFSKALCIWFASHYIFNLEYSKPLKEVCLFFQEFVFKLPQKTKKTATYLTTSSDICKYIV